MKNQSNSTELEQLQDSYLQSVQHLLSEQYIITDDTRKENKQKRKQNDLILLVATILIVAVIGLMLYQNMKKK